MIQIETRQEQEAMLELLNILWSGDWKSLFARIEELGLDYGDVYAYIKKHKCLPPELRDYHDLRKILKDSRKKYVDNISQVFYFDRVQKH